VGIQPIDAVSTPAASTLDRRTTFHALLLATSVVMFALPASIDAGRKSNKKGKKKARQLCQRQSEQCITDFEEVCDVTDDPEACLQAFTNCCAEFAECSVAGFFTCASTPA
jgi:hypothetical protein